MTQSPNDTIKSDQQPPSSVWEDQWIQGWHPRVAIIGICVKGVGINTLTREDGLPVSDLGVKRTCIEVGGVVPGSQRLKTMEEWQYSPTQSL